MFRNKGASRTVQDDMICENCEQTWGEHTGLECPIVSREQVRPDTSVLPEPSALDSQIGGDHYSKKPIQQIEYCHRNGLGPCESAIVKYATRWRDKGGLQDLLKIKHYVDLLIELEGLK